MKFIFGLLFASLLLNNIEATKFPKCSGCTVYATGKDGVVWGWEEDNFCKISSSKCGITIRKSTTIRKSSTTTPKTTTSTKTTTTNNSTSSSTSTPSYDANGNIKCNGCEVTSTKSDKSLWGQENGKSCIIDENKCKEKLSEKKDSNEAHKKVDVNSSDKKDTDSNEEIVCTGCQVTSTGKDNTLWGIENGTSCKIDETLCKNKTKTNSQNSSNSNTKIGFSRVSKVEVESSSQNNINMNHLYAAIAILTLMVMLILL